MMIHCLALAVLVAVSRSSSQFLGTQSPSIKPVLNHNLTNTRAIPNNGATDLYFVER